MGSKMGTGPWYLQAVAKGHSQKCHSGEQLRVESMSNCGKHLRPNTEKVYHDARAEFLRGGGIDRMENSEEMKMLRKREQCKKG